MPVVDGCVGVHAIIFAIKAPNPDKLVLVLLSGEGADDHHPFRERVRHKFLLEELDP
ncbi:MAG TPA: hypothetical protein VKV73_16265 [Chloroflexota bacterium]|nr:hypothetical protein [Chloroflexota bacterium]